MHAAISSQLTDTSTYWHLRFTWILQVTRIIWFHVTLSNTILYQARIQSHVCQNLFFRAPVALFWSNRRHIKQLNKTLACSLHQMLGAHPQLLSVGFCSYLKFVDSFSRLKSVWQKHCNCHRPNTTRNRCDSSSNLGGLLITDISDEPITPRALRVLQHSKSLVSISSKKSNMKSQRSRKSDNSHWKMQMTFTG